MWRGRSQMLLEFTVFLYLRHPEGVCLWLRDTSFSDMTPSHSVSCFGRFEGSQFMYSGHLVAASYTRTDSRSHTAMKVPRPARL
jgi:hypothetical protein